MRVLWMTAAAAALVGVGALGTGLRAQSDGSSALRDAIAAQQRQTLEASGAAEPDATEAVAAQDLFTEEELNDLVAPVALYPDALLAQVLVAAAFPLQVAKADQLIDLSADMSEEELSDSLSQQEFDPSVLVLMSGFPTVISRMADDIDWTDRLGQAMVAQDDDVLAAVQRMRLEAEETGNLTSNDAQVVEKDEGQIYIKPADPEVVYVPTYNPETVYTTPYNPATTPAPYVAQTTSSNPLANPLVAGALAFGGALLVTELFDDDDNNNGNKNKGGWEDYWRGDRPIHWNDRQFYPRPVYATGARPTSWSGERDRYWDRRTARWNRDDADAIRAYHLGRQDTIQELQHTSKARAERMREAARDERARAEAQRERITNQRQNAAVDRDKARAAADRQRRQEAAEADARRQNAAERARDARKSADQQDKAQAARRDRQAEQAKAAANEARKEEEAKRARAEERAKQARADSDAKRKAQDDQNKNARAKAADEERAKQARADSDAKRKAAEDQEKKAKAKATDDGAQARRKAAADQERAKAAAAQRDQEKKAADKRKAARQAANKCEQNPKSKGCKGSN